MITFDFLASAMLKSCLITGLGWSFARAKYGNVDFEVILNSAILEMVRLGCSRLSGILIVELVLWKESERSVRSIQTLSLEWPKNFRIMVRIS